MKKLIFAIVILAYGAHAQTPGQFSGLATGVSPNPNAPALKADALNAEFGTKADANKVTPSVANLLALQVVTPTSPSIRRAGYSTAGDGGAAIYNYSSSPCVLNGGAGDSGLQVAAAGGGCWVADFSATLPTPMVWGAGGNGLTNDTAPVQAAITAMANATLYTGPYLYKLGSGVTSAAPIRIVGIGRGETVFEKSCVAGFQAGAPNLNLFTFNANNSSMHDLCIAMSPATGAGGNTAGSAVTTGAISNFVMSNILITNPCIGVNVGPGNSINIDHAQIRQVSLSGCEGISLGQNDTDGQLVDFRLTNSTIDCATAAPATAGVYIYDAGGPMFSNDDVVGCSVGTIIKPGVNQVVEWAFFGNTTMGDTDVNEDLLIDTASASGAVIGFQATGSWASSAQAGPAVSVNNTGGGTVRGIHFLGLRAYNAAKDGIQINGGDNVTVDASQVCRNNESNGGFGGIAVSANLTDFAIRGTRSGQCDNIPITITQAYGLSLGSGNAEVTLLGNDFSGNTTPFVGPTPTSANAIGYNIGIDTVVQTISSAATIALGLTPQEAISGNTAISTIGGAWVGRQVTLIPTSAGLTFSIGGTSPNGLCSNFTASQYVPILATYSQGLSCWLLK